MVDLVVLQQANLRLWLDATPSADNLTVLSLHATAGANAPVALTFAAADRPVLPTGVFVADGAVTRLKTIAELKAEAQAFVDAMNAAATVALKEEKARLLEALRAAQAAARRIEASVDLAGGAFGIDGFAGTGTAQASLALDLSHLLPTDTFGDPPGPAELALDVRIEAAGVLTGIANGDFALAAEIELEVAAAAFNCDLGLTLPSLPRLPALRLRLPRFTLPNWSFGAIVIPNLPANWLSFLRLDLRTPVTVAISNNPQMSLSVAASKLAIATTTPADGSVLVNGAPVLGFSGVSIAAAAGAVTLAGTLTTPQMNALSVALPAQSYDAAFLPFTVAIASPTLNLGQATAATYNLATGVGALSFANSIDLPRIELKAKDDPSLTLAFAASYEVDFSSAEKLHGKLTRLELLTPYPVALLARAGREAIAGVLRLISMIKLPEGPDTPDYPSTPNTGPLLDHLVKFLSSCARWLAREIGGAGHALFGILEVAVDAVGRVLTAVRKTAQGALSHVTIEARLDADTFALRQIVITPLRRDGSVLAPDLPVDFAGFHLSLPNDARPSLVIDLTGSAPVVALVVAPSGSMTLSTDLWLDRGSGAEAASAKADNPGPGKNQLPLVAITVTPTQPIALIALSSGHPRFFQELVVDGPLDETEVVNGNTYRVMLLRGRPRFRSLSVAEAFKVDLNIEAAKRLLPFLSSPKKEAAAGGSLFDGLSQYVAVKQSEPVKVDGGVAKLAVEVAIHIGGDDVDATLQLDLDLETLEVKIEGGKQIFIEGTEEARDFLGLQLKMVSDPPVHAPAKFRQFVLDFSGGDARLALAPGVSAQLAYTRIASRGAGLVFKVSEFAITREGVDLDAEVDSSAPVQLAGVDMPFRFSRGRLSVRRGELQGFAIQGSGQLPPALVGEANANISIAMARDGAGRLAVQSAEAELEKAGAPLVCKSTRFTLAISKLGLSFQDFGLDGVHFYFLLTGSARFTPGGGEFASGLLKYFPDLTITLEKAPLAGDARLLLRRISLQVAVNPPRRIKLFELFEFELRGVGFYPSSELFHGKAALSVSGQMFFLEAGDAVGLGIQFHEILFSGPKDNEALPQVRFDGITVSLALGAVGSVEGTAIAVDGNTPSLYRPDLLPSDVTPSGFLASGRIAISGWPPMSAAMGYLELKRGNGDLRRAFFLYAQLNRLAVKIPTPIGTFFLREAGFGFGFRYTLAALAEADTVEDPKALVRVLDSVSKYQGELSNVRAWEPEQSGDHVTLAMRAMFTMSALSKDGQLDPREETLPNPVLFDATVALRSDLTLLMTVRAWLCVNYWRWDKALSTDPLRANPSLRGYIYVSVPRQEFLGRMVAARDGVVGDTPPLNSALKKMLEAVDWSATLFIRPGLFHQELGWPYELRFQLGDPQGNFAIDCSGGMILRVEDGAVLQGLAFRARGFAQFGGAVGGGSIGASVYARADFEIGAKFISYLSLTHFDESLLYGAINFNLTVRFSIRFWLDIDAGLFHIHLEAGFSASFCLTVALELAASPKGLGGRGCAQLAISAFGRTLGVSVGFGFGGDLLQTARARVDRFLALGLATSVPDPAAGLAAPPPPLAQAPTAATKAADKASDDATQTHDRLNPQGGDDALLIDVGPSRFWALLRPTALVKGYILTLIPRDRTSIDLDSVEPLALTDSEFYAPDGGVYTLSVGAGAAGLWWLRHGAAQQVGAGGARIVADYKTLDAARAEGSGESLTLDRLVGSCFLKDSQGRPKQLRAPRVISAARQPLPSDAGEAGAALRRAAEKVAAASPLIQSAIAVDQRRSSIVAAVHDSVVDLSASLTLNGQAEPVTPARATPAAHGSPVIDARDFGLTFFVAADDLDRLFPAAPGNGPRVARFSVKREGEGAGAGAVYLLNPPDRFFNRTSPVLAGAKVVQGGDFVGLDWDLEPFLARSQNPYDDPEFQLVHYRIARAIVMNQAVSSRFPAKPVTVKAAAPLDYDHGDETWKPIRPSAQFTDRFEDLPDAARRALLGLGDAPDQDWDQQFREASEVELVYTVVPVDIAGTAGAPRVMTKTIGRPAAPVKALKSAQFLVKFAQLPHLGQVSAPPELWLAVVDPQPAAELTYTLRLRRERGFAGGVYGADSVTEAMQRPQPDSFAEKFADDVDFVVTLTGSLANLASDADPLPILDSKPDAGAWFRLKGTRLAAFQDELRKGAQGGDPFARRIGVLRGRPEDAAPGQQAWAVADLSITIKPEASVDDPARVTTPGAMVAVETFEWPAAASFDALGFDDLAGSSGRVMILHPSASANLANCGDNGSAQPLRDRKRRVGARVVWNARPTAAGKRVASIAASERPGFIGGFDVFSIDRTALLGGGASAAHAQRAARVQALAPRMRALDPAQIDDFGALESYYPSLTARMTYPATHLGEPASQTDGLRPWFSEAESLLAWPQWGVRRSPGLNLEEADLGPLFAKGTPNRFTFGLALPKGVTMPDGLALPQFVHAGADVAPGVNPRSALRGALRNLALSPESCGVLDAALRDRRMRGEGDIDALKRIQLTIESLKDGVGQGEAILPLDLQPALHPVLADVVDAIRWGEDDGALSYRRYTPVFDAPPPTQAKSIAAFLAERPEPRDPAGWAALRTFGLAVGFKLFDMEQGDYCEPTTTLAQLNAALAIILPRYAGLRLGAPFVDILSRPDGLISLESFDGSARAATPALADMLRDDALALVQVALRPIPEALALPAGPPQAVQYFRITAPVSSQITVDLDLLPAPPSSQSVLIEIADLNGGFSAPRPVALARRDDLVAGRLLARERPEGASLKFTQQNERCAFARVVALSRDEAAIDLAALLTACTRATPAAGLLIEPVATPAATRYVDGPQLEPFGAFDPLPADAVKALMWGARPVDLKAKLQGGETANQPAFRPAPSARAGYEDFAAAARPHFAEGWPTADADSQALTNLAQRLSGLTRRFLANGPAGPLDPGVVPFSLTALLRADLWRAAPTAAGRMEITLLFEDRYALRRRFVVRPFGRYENLQAAGAADHGLGRAPTLADIADGDAAFAERSVDIVAPRTHPLDPPVILSSARIDPNPDPATGSGKRLGEVQEIVVARHAEEILSEANFDVADRLSFAYVGVGLLRGFSVPSWGGLFPGVDIEQDFGDGAFGAVPSLSFAADSFSIDAATEGAHPEHSLANRMPDGWKGITALRIRRTPHAVNLHAVAYAAAGVVVSDAAAARVSPSRYTLGFPWVPGAHADFPAPAWTVSTERTIDLSIPLVRYLDGMFDEDCHEWFSEGSPANLFKLPDFDVSFALDLARDAGAGPVPSGPDDAKTEIEFAPSIGAAPAYAARLKGERFLVRSSAVTPADDGASRGWVLRLAIARQAPAPTHVAPTTLAQSDYQGLEAFETTAANWAAWAPLAPSRTATLTIRRPDEVVLPGHTDWTPFEHAVATAADLYFGYAGSPEAQALAAELQRFRNVASSAQWDALSPGHAEYVRAGLTAPLGLPRPGGAALPATAFVRVELGMNTTPPPAPASSVGAERSRRAVIGADAQGDAYRRALRRLDIGARAAAEALPHPATYYEAMAFPLPSSDPAILAAALALAGENLPATLSFLIETPIDARAWAGERDPDSGPLADLIDALEAHSGAAGLLRRGAADALAALAALADRGHAAMAVALPHRLNQDAAVAARLRAFRAHVGDASENAPTVVGFVLHEPPSDLDLAALRELCDRLATDATRFAFAAWREAIATRAREQLLGPDRTLRWTAFHGFADPVHASLGRAP